MSNHKSPYMMETAFKYLQAAKLLWNNGNLSGVAMVNAAIALEIILKSFLATPAENSRKGTVSEQYEFTGKRLHLLTGLASQIEPNLFKELGFDKHLPWFKEYDNLFVQARYPYEPSSNGGHTEIPLKIGISMFNSAIDWYKATGNTDPWIVQYPNVTGGCL